MKRIFLPAFFIFTLGINSSFALEWKALHEKADKLDLTEAKMAVEKNPGSADNLYILGLVYFNLRKDDLAEEVFSRLLKSRPELIEAKWGLAEALRRKHDIGKSQELVNEVTKASPKFAPAYITLAYIKYIQLGFEESVKLAHKVLDMGEKRVDLSNRVRAYLMLGGAKGMIAHYGGPFSKLINGTAVLPTLKSAQKLQPDSAGVLFGLGSFYLLAPRLAGGDIAIAEDYLQRAIKADPLFADAYVRLAQLYKAKGQMQKYSEYLAKALEIDPANEVALDTESGACKFACPDRKE